MDRRLTAGAFALLVTASTALGTVKNLKSFEIKNATGSDATTYNLILNGVKAEDIDRGKVTGTLKLVEVSNITGGVILRFRDEDNPIKAGKSGTFKVPMRALPDDKQLRIYSSSWSSGGISGRWLTTPVARRTVRAA